VEGTRRGGTVLIRKRPPIETTLFVSQFRLMAAHETGRIIPHLRLLLDQIFERLRDLPFLIASSTRGQAAGFFYDFPPNFDQSLNIEKLRMSCHRCVPCRRAGAEYAQSREVPFRCGDGEQCFTRGSDALVNTEHFSGKMTEGKGGQHPALLFQRGKLPFRFSERGRKPTQASLAPVMLATFAFEHTHGPAGAGIEDLTDKAWQRFAARAGRFGVGHLQ
jgi:hypothetical protein